MVEFALIAPILLLLLIGLFEAAIGLNAYVTVSNASAEAVRYATAHPGTDIATIRTAAVVAHSQQLDTSVSTLTLAGTYGSPPNNWPSAGVPTSSPSARVPIQMTVTYNWGDTSHFLGELFKRLLGGNATFSATANGETIR